MSNGEDIDIATFEAIDDPIVADQKFANIFSSKLNHAAAGFREILQDLNRRHNTLAPLNDGWPILAFYRNIAFALKQTHHRSRRPTNHRPNSLRRLSSSSLSRLRNSLCVRYSPRASSVSATLTSSINSRYAMYSSQSAMFPIKVVGLPFCVMKSGRCDSATCLKQEARLLRHSEKEITSSVITGRGMRVRFRLTVDFSSICIFNLRQPY